MTDPAGGVPVGGHRTDVQGLRAVAVVLVVVYHVGLFAGGVSLPGGFTGVDVFFVISGYVITRMLLGDLRRSRGVALRRFYLRRVRRLVPALALMLAVIIPAAQVLGPIGGQSVTARTGVAASASLANAYLMLPGTAASYFDPGAEMNALLHTWSLSVEEQFYLVFPVFLLAAWNLARRVRPRSTRWAVAVIVTLTSLISFGITLFLAAGADDRALFGPVAFYSPVTRAWEFGAGALVALAAARTSTIPRRAATATSLAGLLLIALAAVAIGPDTAFPGLATLVPVSGTVLVLAGGERGGNLVSRALSWPPAQRVGDLSYGWYLWHWPAIVFAVALVPGTSLAPVAAGILSLAPAIASARWVERPIRFAPNPRPRRSIAMALGCTLVPPLLAASVIAADLDEEPATFAAAFARHTDEADGCAESEGLAPGADGTCVHGVDGPTGRAVLVGDSNAGHLYEGFVAAAGSADLEAVVAVRSACPFVRMEVDHPTPAEAERCRRYQERTRAALHADPPEVLVVANADDAYLTGGPLDDIEPASWSTAVRNELAPLVDAGVHVVVVQTAPRFGTWEPRWCARALWSNAPQRCGASVDRDVSTADRAQSTDATAAGAEAAGATLVDPFAVVCPDSTCRTEHRGTWLFRDSGHYSVAGSAMLEDTLRAAIAGWSASTAVLG